MSKIDHVKDALENKDYFFHDSGTNYIRVLDTPHVWGEPFGPEIMPQSIYRQGEFERAIEEIIQKSRYRCDVASLNSPDPDWGKVILGAMDTALSEHVGRTRPTQFRFLFGQTPMVPVGEPWNLIDFKAALIRLVRSRSAYWEMEPEIWIGRFYQFSGGILDALKNKLFPSGIISDYGTKMTWNHSKIIAMDGVEALVGGHNLNMDLFRSYPPVHDVSVVVHGGASYGAQLFLNEMWKVGTNLFTKQTLNVDSLKWVNRDSASNQPTDPFFDSVIGLEVQDYIARQQDDLISMHESGSQSGQDPQPPDIPPLPSPDDIEAYDLQTIDDLAYDVFQERNVYNTYASFNEYKKAPRILSVGKYWVGLNRETDFKIGSEIMKKNLILNAERIIRMSQMDLISAWKSKWADHMVCQWLIEALLENPYLRVQIVVSPLDAGAGAEGDQYSFGSGAIRTFELMEYYMKHRLDDSEIPDPYGVIQHAIDRLSVAPLFYTNQVPADSVTEGQTYKWPDLTQEGYTYTLKQKPLAEDPPRNGDIGHPAVAVANAGGFTGGPVKSAPGNHAKIMIVDDEVYVVGSDNLYPGNLSEFNYLIEGEAVDELLQKYWHPLWQYSEPHRVCSCAPSGMGVVSTINEGTEIRSEDAFGYVDDNDSVSMEVVLLDSFGNPVSDVKVTFERKSGSANPVSPEGYTDNQGRFFTYAKSQATGFSEFVAKFDSNGNGTPDKYVVYGSPVSVKFNRRGGKR